MNTTTTTPETFSDRAYAACGMTAGDTVTLTVDAENNADEWWSAMRAALRAGNVPLTPSAKMALRAFDRADRALVTRQVATEIMLWGETLPGWDDGPEYARDPFVVVEGGDED